MIEDTGMKAEVIIIIIIKSYFDIRVMNMPTAFQGGGTPIDLVI